MRTCMSLPRSCNVITLVDAWKAKKSRVYMGLNVGDWCLSFCASVSGWLFICKHAPSWAYEKKYYGWRLHLEKLGRQMNLYRWTLRSTPVVKILKNWNSRGRRYIKNSKTLHSLVNIHSELFRIQKRDTMDVPEKVTYFPFLLPHSTPCGSSELF